MPALPAGHVWATWKPIWSVLGPDLAVINHGDKRAIPEGEAHESDNWEVTVPAPKPAADKPKDGS